MQLCVCLSVWNLRGSRPASVMHLVYNQSILIEGLILCLLCNFNKGTPKCVQSSGTATTYLEPMLKSMARVWLWLPSNCEHEETGSEFWTGCFSLI